MDLGLKNKVALVTGGTRGIGKAIVAGLVAEGCGVAFTGRTKTTLQETDLEMQQIGRPEKLVPIQADMTIHEHIEHALEIVFHKWGRLDILINNVGGSLGGGGFDKSSEEQLRGVFEINLFAAYNASKLAIPYMRESGQGGRILTISSVWGRESGGGAAYNAAKAAEIAMSKAMAQELAKEGILVNTVAPGSILFPGGGWDRRFKDDPEGQQKFIDSELPLGRFGSPEEVANVVVFLASERASLVTGACWSVDGSQGRSNI